MRPTPRSQLAMDVVFDSHPMLTKRDGELLTPEADHRAHAVTELAIRDLKAAGPAWALATVASLRSRLVCMPARLVHSARRLSLRAPRDWPWQQAFDNVMAACRTIAPAALT